MKTLIKNGFLVNPKTLLEGMYDIWLEDDTIISVVPNGTIRDVVADVTIDARGNHVFPGFIDLHVHLREPGFEHKETIRSGTLACAKGGYTTVACMPNTKPTLDTIENIMHLKNIIERDALIEVLPIGAITKNIAGDQLTDHEALFGCGLIGLSDDGRTTMNADFMKAALDNASKYNRLIMTHSEDHLLTEHYKDSIYPIESETTIVKRDIDLCKAVGGRLHVGHVSGQDAIEAIRSAKKEGVCVTCEATPHHFALNDAMIDVMNPMAKVNPPIRSEAHRRAVIEGLRDGTIDIIATDHAPHDEASKSLPYEKAAFGISGIETAFSVAYTVLVEKEKIPLIKLIAMLSKRPAEIAQLDLVGSIEPGYKGNVVIVDLNKEMTVDSKNFLSKGKNTPFDHMTFKAIVVKTLYHGKTVYESEACK